MTMNNIEQLKLRIDTKLNEVFCGDGFYKLSFF